VKRGIETERLELIEDPLPGDVDVRPERISIRQVVGRIAGDRIDAGEDAQI
jgi:hypothetical protein